MTVGVALACTVKDERDSIDALLDSLAGQTRRPDEVVIVDGGSQDGTAERIAARAGALGIRLLHAPGANIARGRNLAIAATAQEIIAVTDAGVRLAPHWLERLTAPFDGAEPPAVVAGFFAAEARTPFERALGATTLPERRDVDPAHFLPSSRSVAFRRVWWQRVGGYPEWLDYGEDLVFDLALQRAGARFEFAPEAVVYYRPRATLGAFFRQYYCYGRGDGKADLWPGRHAIRYGVYALAASLIGSAPQQPGVLGLLAALGALYLRRPYGRLLPSLRDLSPAERLQALAVVPLIRLTGDVAKMLGYPVGVWWRLRRRRGERVTWRHRDEGDTSLSASPRPRVPASRRGEEQ
ncbi:MAG: glycosyltransferase [Chloroflexi bacterium]|nr:glycosyltransferase [Chloroflexota bacterium]